jgi:hypothetical protein
VSEDTEKSEGRGVGTVTVGAKISEGRGVGVTGGAVMEGNDVKNLIAKRLGISKDKVDARLVALHNKGELAGTADRGRPTAGPSGQVKSPTLTKKRIWRTLRNQRGKALPSSPSSPPFLARPRGRHGHRGHRRPTLLPPSQRMMR